MKSESYKLGKKINNKEKLKQYIVIKVTWMQSFPASQNTV